VSILFADLVGSTGLGERLDPESMHRVLDRVSDLCGGAIERHGGCVEGFIGDAVVGVFGLDRLHEDDALRAVRAAVEVRDAVPALSAELERERGIGVALKLGVESGEVFVSGGARRPAFAAGDAFNVAARLQGMASAGEILLGENAQRLVAAVARAEPLDEPLELRGRSAPVSAWRLVDLADGAPERPATSPFVDRERELGVLRAAQARAREQRACQPVTIVGPAGIGKSRLVRELARPGDEALVAVGRCQSYGEGTAYQPVAEIVRALGDAAEPAAALLPGAGRPTRAAQTEEVFWAVRRALEAAAAERPLVAVFEDVHWAEPTLLDLIDYLSAFSSGAATVAVATARPDFAEKRPDWVAPRGDRVVLSVEPLGEDDARRLVGDAEAADRIVETAEGNPLFLEQLVAMEPGGDEAALPSTIQAVLAARIDALAPEPRSVLETASVQGRAFHAGPLADQLDDRSIPSHLVALVRDQQIGRAHV
jgi:class 3 adenylate cyclase